MSAKFTDKTPMPWGKHKGVKLSEVPSEYMLWLADQEWISGWPELNRYLRESMKALKAEVRNDDEDSGGMETYDDYMGEK